MKLKNFFNKSIRHDGWINFFTRLGVPGKDRVTSAYYTHTSTLDRGTLSIMYRTDGFAKRIVDLVAHEMTRQWFSVSGDVENRIIGRLEDIDAKNKIRELLTWSRLYGGAIAVLGLKDGGDLADPLDEEALMSVDFIHIFDRYQVTWQAEDLYQDPANKKFNTPEYYRITPGQVKEGEFVVHESRVLRIDGEMLPNVNRSENLGWGDSVLQAAEREIKHLGLAYGATANIMQDFIQTILTVDNLAGKIGAGQEDEILKRLDIINQSRSVANTVIIDSKEGYQKQASSVGGLEALIDRFTYALSAVTGIPGTLLMGTSPGGLNATGISDVRLFYDMIKAEQEDKLQPILERLVRLIMISKDGPFGGVEPEAWQIQFNPLWQLTGKEEADYRKVIAEIDSMYIDRNVLDPSEVAISRFGGNIYSAETTIDVAAREESSVSVGALDPVVARKIDDLGRTRR